mmetsp:Transcript_91057/g.256635  ORF Transcript_91057/g.256635 Transcript_91057/m.256635 type:complete len:234 (-) Transcript_91057:608-1309(-)
MLLTTEWSRPARDVSTRSAKGRTLAQPLHRDASRNRAFTSRNKAVGTTWHFANTPSSSWSQLAPPPSRCCIALAVTHGSSHRGSCASMWQARGTTSHCAKIPKVQTAMPSTPPPHFSSAAQCSRPAAARTKVASSSAAAAAAGEKRPSNLAPSVTRCSAAPAAEPQAKTALASLYPRKSWPTFLIVLSHAVSTVSSCSLKRDNPVCRSNHKYLTAAVPSAKSISNSPKNRRSV